MCFMERNNYDDTLGMAVTELQRLIQTCFSRHLMTSRHFNPSSCLARYIRQVNGVKLAVILFHLRFRPSVRAHSYLDANILKTVGDRDSVLTGHPTLYKSCKKIDLTDICTL